MNSLFEGLNPMTLLALCALGMVLLYLGRAQVHHALMRASRVLASALRLAARAVADRLRQHAGGRHRHR